LFALGTGLVVGSVPPEQAGSAASMSETSNYLGGALGMAMLGAIGASVYRGHMAHAVAAGAPASAGETIAGAATASQHLPAAQAAELIRTASDAFTSGLNVTGVIVAVIFGALAVLIATMRRARTESAPTPGARRASSVPRRARAAQGDGREAGTTSRRGTRQAQARK
jgi:DHA2 family multidrug resistance protein-like MFS transporter